MPAGLTVLHTSDFQCGEPYLPHVGEALVRIAHDIAPDVVVVSGDLTQRAKRREFEQARELVDRLGPVPVVLTPGNHDVPLYRVWERLLDPFGNWRRFTGEESLDSVTRVDGATIVALHSAAPRRAIVNGRIDDGQVTFARRAFDDCAPNDLRLLVTHHHFVPIPQGRAGRPLPGAARLAEAFGQMGVDVLMGGHVHQIHLRTASEIVGCPRRDPPLPIVTCGTSTSRRGRGPEGGLNSLNVLRFSSTDVEVTPYLRSAGTQEFEALAARSWALRRGSRTAS